MGVPYKRLLLNAFSRVAWLTWSWLHGLQENPRSFSPLRSNSPLPTSLLQQKSRLQTVAQRRSKKAQAARCIQSHWGIRQVQWTAGCKSSTEGQDRWLWPFPLSTLPSRTSPQCLQHSLIVLVLSRRASLVRTYWRCCQCALVAPFCGRWALSNTIPTNDTQLPLNPHRSMRTCAVLIRTDENRAASQSCRASSLTLQQNVASKHKHTVVLCSLYIAVQCFYSVWFTPPRLPRHIVQSKWNRRVRPISRWQQWKKGGTQRS